MATRGTPVRTFRADDELWLSATKIAKAQGKTVPEVLRTFLGHYVAKYRHLLVDDVSVAEGTEEVAEDYDQIEAEQRAIIRDQLLEAGLDASSEAVDEVMRGL